MSVMSRFSNALQSALDGLGWSQIDFADRCHINRSALNKYARGKLGVGAGTLETIARELPDRERAEVIAAWLRDAIPMSSSGLITVLTGGRLEEQEEMFRRGELSRELDSAVRFLIEEARRHTVIGDLLIDLARALRGHD